MIVTLIIVLVGIVLYMGYRVNILEKKFKKIESRNRGIAVKPVKVEQGDIVLKKLKEKPDISDIDPNHQLLKDVIETAKYENWKADIEEERHSWRFKITNPSKTLTISCILRRYDDKIRLGYFNVSGPGSISYVDVAKEDPKYLIVEYLWSLIVDKNEKDCQEITQNYLTAKSLIEKELKSLRRNKQLDNLFGDNLEV